MIDIALLSRLWPHAQAPLVAGIVASVPTVLPKYSLDAPLVMAHFLAQVSEECGAGTELIENLNYTHAERIVAVWPSRFTIDSAQAYTHNPRGLADKVYNGRMGNTLSSDDGWNYRGRGATQTTGRDGYAALGAKTGLDLLNNPDLVNDPAHFLECGAADFIICGCLPPALADDIRTVTRRLNGGYTNLNDRVAWFSTWKQALNVH